MLITFDFAVVPAEDHVEVWEAMDLRRWLMRMANADTLESSIGYMAGQHSCLLECGSERVETVSRLPGCFLCSRHSSTSTESSRSTSGMTAATTAEVQTASSRPRAQRRS